MKGRGARKISRVTNVEALRDLRWAEVSHTLSARRARRTRPAKILLDFRRLAIPIRFAVCVDSSNAGVEIIEGLAELNLAALSNVLRVVLDGPPQDAADLIPVWLKVVGIEDLLAEQISSWMARRSPTGDISARIHALDALSRAGVGGRLRTGYLQRRMAWEIHGEVVLGSWLSEEGREPDPVARTTSPTGAKGRA